MAAQTLPDIDPADVAKLIRETERYLRNVANTPGTVVIPATVAGWTVVAAPFAAFAGLLGGIIAVGVFAEILLGPSPAPKTRLLTRGGDATRALREVQNRLKAASGHADIGLGLGLVGQVLSLERLTERTNVLASWRQGHHRLTHGRQAVAEPQRIGAEVAAGAAIEVFGSATVAALKEIVDVRLPDLRTDLLTKVQVLRDLVRDNDHELRRGILELERTITEEITEVRRWVRWEIIPEVRRQIETETEARKKADTALRVGLAEAVDTSTDADAKLWAAIAPLIAFVSGPGTHTAEKVKRTEGMFDQLMRSDLNWAAALFLPPAFTALVTKIVGRIAPATPEALLGLERAASRALGAF